MVKQRRWKCGPPVAGLMASGARVTRLFGSKLTLKLAHIRWKGGRGTPSHYYSGLLKQPDKQEPTNTSCC